MTSIRLALSGGGFRAALFHLGTLACLKKANLLKDVSEVSGTSGGAILAAFARLHWPKLLDESEDSWTLLGKIVALAKNNLRGRILTHWLTGLFGPLLLPRAWRASFSKTHFLIRRYESLFETKTLENFTAQDGMPSIALNCTDLVQGIRCAFHNSSFAFWKDAPSNPPRSVGANKVPISVAVAASSCFPPLFEPVQTSPWLPRTSAKGDPVPRLLVDGGILDNLGSRAFDLTNSRDALVVNSDAEPSFEKEEQYEFEGFVARNSRSFEISSRQISNMEQERLRAALSTRHLSVSIRESDCSDMPAIDQHIASIRTDLDRFDSQTAYHLIKHGYDVCRKALSEGQLKPPGEGLSAKEWNRLGITPREFSNGDTARKTLCPEGLARIRSFIEPCSGEFLLLAGFILGFLFLTVSLIACYILGRDVFAKKTQVRSYLVDTQLVGVRLEIESPSVPVANQRPMARAEFQVSDSNGSPIAKFDETNFTKLGNVWSSSGLESAEARFQDRGVSLLPESLSLQIRAFALESREQPLQETSAHIRVFGRRANGDSVLLLSDSLTVSDRPRVILGELLVSKDLRRVDVDGQRRLDAKWLLENLNSPPKYIELPYKVVSLPDRLSLGPWLSVLWILCISSLIVIVLRLGTWLLSGI